MTGSIDLWRCNLQQGTPIAASAGPASRPRSIWRRVCSPNVFDRP